MRVQSLHGLAGVAVLAAAGVFLVSGCGADPASTAVRSFSGSASGGSEILPASAGDDHPFLDVDLIGMSEPNEGDSKTEIAYKNGFAYQHAWFGQLGGSTIINIYDLRHLQSPGATAILPIHLKPVFVIDGAWVAREFGVEGAGVHPKVTQPILLGNDIKIHTTPDGQDRLYISAWLVGSDIRIIIVDISNPYHPRLLGGFDHQDYYGHATHNIHVWTQPDGDGSSHVYLMTNSFSGLDESFYGLYDVTDPSAVRLLNDFAWFLPSSLDTYVHRHVFPDGEVQYRMFFASWPGVYIIDVTDPEHPRRLALYLYDPPAWDLGTHTVWPYPPEHLNGQATSAIMVSDEESFGGVSFIATDYIDTDRFRQTHDGDEFVEVDVRTVGSNARVNGESTGQVWYLGVLEGPMSYAHNFDVLDGTLAVAWHYMGLRLFDLRGGPLGVFLKGESGDEMHWKAYSPAFMPEVRDLVLVTDRQLGLLLYRLTPQW